MSLSPIPDWYQTTTRSFYDLQATGEDERSLWDAFLQSESAQPYTTIDPVTGKRIIKSELIDDVEVRGAYVQFLTKKLKNVYQSEALNRLSESELMHRQIIYTIFQILQTLIGTVAQSELTSSKAMEFLTKKQTNYANLLKKAFFYTGIGEIDKEFVDSILTDWGFTKNLLDTTVTDPAAGNEYPSSADWYFTRVTYNTNPSDPTYNKNPAECILGYGNLSLADIATYCAVKGTEKDSVGSSFTMESPSTIFTGGDENPVYSKNTCTFSTTLVTPQGSTEPQIQTTVTFTKSIDIDKLVALYQAAGEISDIETFKAEKLAEAQELARTYYPNLSGTTLTSTSYSILCPKDNFEAISTGIENSFFQAYTAAYANQTVMALTPANIEKLTELQTLIDQTSDEALKNILIATKQKATDLFYKMQTPLIPWEVGSLAATAVDKEDKKTAALLQQIQKQRAARNQAMSSNVRSIKAKIDLLQSKREQLSQIAQASTTSRKMTAQVISSLLAQLSSIISTITK